ncbi:MAG: SDR family oxidoreductase [Dehalococcoidia bacterium]|nr:SDR family oxidoreductase [Dehalococcoidia bacterium]
MTNGERPPFFDLSGKHALVTGATGPLQRAVAVALAEAGANVSLTTLHDAQDEEVQANSILNECWSTGRQGQAKRLDLTDPAAVDSAVEALEGEVGPIDILVNAAHAATIKPVAEASLDDWSSDMADNATSVFVATNAVGKRMLQRGKGRVITLVSILEDRGVPNCAIYGASQGAVLGFTRSLGIEWVRQGVTVNAIGIGFYDDVPGPQQDEATRAVLERYIPLRRLGTPQDLQGTVVYLASDESAFVDAEVLTVDGAIAIHA